MIGLFDHPWFGDLYGDEKIIRIFSPEMELQRMLRIEAAWTRALGKVENSGETEAVARKIEQLSINPKDLREGTARDGVPVPELVALIRAATGPASDSWVHVGMTSQDVIDTALMLSLRDVAEVLHWRLGNYVTALTDCEHRCQGRTLTAYTRMQPALETSADSLIARWRHPLPGLADDLSRCRTTLGVIQWGGAIGARDHPRHIELGSNFAALLGLSDPGEAWHTDRTRIVDFASILSRICLATGKLGEDTALMAALGTGQIKLSGGGTSSAMGHKCNPIKSEALSTLASHCAMAQGNLQRSALHEGYRSGRAWSLEWLTIPNLCQTAGASLMIAETLVAEIDALGC